MWLIMHYNTVKEKTETMNTFSLVWFVFKLLIIVAVLLITIIKDDIPGSNVSLFISHFHSHNCV